jgi:hypothetical protein
MAGRNEVKRSKERKKQMKTATVRLESISPYSQSRPIQEPRKPKETFADHEERTWRERLHVTDNGEVFIPPMAFKNCVSQVAKYLSKQIPGKGKATYTKHIEAGVLVVDPIPLGIKAKDVVGEWLFVPSSGKRGDGQRVWKCFPVITKWTGEVSFTILDETVTEEVFQEFLEEAGRFIGIGRFRPINNGFYGRFAVKSVQWS